jgi:hypothetical protein
MDVESSHGARCKVRVSAGDVGRACSHDTPGYVVVYPVIFRWVAPVRSDLNQTIAYVRFSNSYPFQSRRLEGILKHMLGHQSWGKWSALRPRVRFMDSEAGAKQALNSFRCVL